MQSSELPSCDQKLECDFECGNGEATVASRPPGGLGGGRCKPPAGYGRSPGAKNLSEMEKNIYITLN